MNTIQDVVQAINATRTTGTIFSVSFTKKDGSERTLVGRLGVKCHLVGGENTVKHIPKYITVFDTQAQAYRNVNTETIKGAKVSGKVYVINQAGAQV